MNQERLTTEELATSMEKDTEGSNTVRQMEEKPAALFPTDEGQRFRDRWTDVQAAFVDEPRHAVEEADALVAETIKRLAEVFSDERKKLEGQWGRGDEVSTEDLRQALRRYRSFFERLLTM